MNILIYQHDSAFSLDKIIIPYLKKAAPIYTIGTQSADFKIVRGKKISSHKLTSFIKKNNITHLLYCENNSFLPPILHILPDTVKTAMILTDTNTGVKKRIPYVKLFDIIFLICKQHEHELKKYNSRIFPLFYGVDTSHFFKMKNTQKKYEVVFVGNIVPWVHYERFFLLNYLRWKGINVIHFRLPYHEINKVFNESMIVINKTPLNGFNMRIFETLGSGSLLLNDYCEENGMTEILKGNKHVVYYHSFQDAYRKITYYLSHEKERESIAQRGHKFAINNYSWEEQIQKLLAILEKQNMTIPISKKSTYYNLSLIEIGIFRSKICALQFLHSSYLSEEISFLYYTYKKIIYTIRIVIVNVLLFLIRRKII